MALLLWVLFAIEVPMLLLQLLVFLTVVLELVGRKHASFSRDFAILYALQNGNDTICYVALVLTTRLPEMGLPSLPPLVVQIGGYVLTYTALYQYAMHTAVALNRFTALVHYSRHEKIWRGFPAGLVHVMLIACPTPSIVVLALNGGGMFDGNGNTFLLLQLGYNASECAVTCLASLCLQLRTFVVYRSLKLSRQKYHKEDYRLLGFASLQVAIQSVSTVFFLVELSDYALLKSGVIAPTTVQIHSAFAGFFCLYSPICLLTASKTFRTSLLRVCFGAKYDKDKSQSVLVSVVFANHEPASWATRRMTC